MQPRTLLESLMLPHALLLQAIVAAKRRTEYFDFDDEKSLAKYTDLLPADGGPARARGRAPFAGSFDSFDDDFGFDDAPPVDNTPPEKRTVNGRPLLINREIK